MAWERIETTKYIYLGPLEEPTFPVASFRGGPYEGNDRAIEIVQVSNGPEGTKNKGLVLMTQSPNGIWITQHIWPEEIIRSVAMDLGAPVPIKDIQGLAEMMNKLNTGEICLS